MRPASLPASEALPYHIGNARYSKGNMAIRPVDGRDGFKGRASYLLDALGARCSGRERSYIVSASKGAKFERLYRAGFYATARAGYCNDELGLRDVSLSVALANCA